MKFVTEANAMPPMGAAFAGWTSPIALIKIKQEVSPDGEVHDIPYTINFKGTVQPLEPRKLYLKPEGQRSFTWLQIHAVGSHERLLPNDRIKYSERKFKVMAILDYSQNNYIEYHACEDFRHE